MKTALKVAFFAGTALLWAGCGGKSGTVIPPAEGAAITQQPLSQTVPIGEAATFTVTATGTVPLSYQWSENGSVIPGATSSSYTTPTVELGAGGSTSIGTFQVTVSNPIGTVRSSTATLSAGARSPKAGDLRYLPDQQVDEPGLLRASGTGGVQIEGNIQSESITNGLGSPLGIGSNACGEIDGEGICGWPFEYQLLPTPVTGLDMFYQPGNYTEYVSDLQSYSAPNIVYTSLDLDPAEDAYALSWVKTTGSGGFDYRIDPLVPSGANQQTQIQAQATLDGTESRVITAASFDAAGNAVLISYGWQVDTTTVYEMQTTVVPPSEVLTATTDLANNGYIISAFGGNDTNGYILIGMRVQGDTLPRPITAANVPTTMPYYSPVVYFFEYKIGTVLWQR
jgi:hypothetical protein